MPPLTRREWLVRASCTLASLSLLPQGRLLAAPLADSPFAALEKQSTGRLGVQWLDTATGHTGGYRASERFPMCSTFKLLLAGAVLHRVDQGREHLDRTIRYGRQDLLPYAPTTSQHVDSGMSVQDLAIAAVTLSDNTAANLLLASIGGPARLTAFLRSIGDPTTRLDRTEPTLNQSIPGDPRDTTSPEAMVATTRKLVAGNVLSLRSRTLLSDWLLACQTGTKRIRAGIPATWKSGDKTGTGPRGTANDVAVLWPAPGRPPIFAAVFLTGATGIPEAAPDQILAQAGSLIAQAIA